MGLIKHTAAIFAWSEGGIGVAAMGLRLARRPATVREDAVALRIGGGRATVGSDGAGESDIVREDGNDGKRDVESVAGTMTGEEGEDGR